MYIYMKLKLISNATNNHSFTHSHTDGGVNHEGRLAQRRLDAQLGGGIEPATFWLPIDPCISLTFSPVKQLYTFLSKITRKCYQHCLRNKPGRLIKETVVQGGAHNTKVVFTST